ncbi:hypothetical protein M0813_15290 [Anaeramoeba flamelloides]|uniref:Uncharacterized protein n=1 Tax=Anaeramoeba flamelloides TaxID=1746091 RepID=A0ABQ8Z379_9EUKA|nr:hypothetical protein M0813_15290 [Anaeramoeba flamelloides]
MLSQTIQTKKLSFFIFHSLVPKRVFSSSQIFGDFNPNPTNNKKTKPKIKTKTKPTLTLSRSQSKNSSPNNNSLSKTNAKTCYHPNYYYLSRYTNPNTQTKFNKCNITRHKNWINISKAIFNDHIQTGTKNFLNNMPTRALSEYESALELAIFKQQKTQCYGQIVSLVQSEINQFSDLNGVLDLLKKANHFSLLSINLSLSINATICMSEIFSRLKKKKKAIKALETIPITFRTHVVDLDDMPMFNETDNQVINLLDLGNPPDLLQEIIALNRLGVRWDQLGYKTRAIEVLLQTFKCIKVIENGTHNMVIQSKSQEEDKYRTFFEKKYQISKCFSNAKAQDVIIFQSQAINLITDMMDIYLKNQAFDILPIFLKELSKRSQYENVIYYLKRILQTITNNQNRLQIIEQYSVYGIPAFIERMRGCIKIGLQDELNSLKELSESVFN